MNPELARTVVPLAFAALVIVAAMTDLATFTIPNWISIALAIAFAPAVLLAGLPLGELASLISWHVGVGVAIFILAAGMFALGWIGGGDAKLFAATALWLGFKDLVPYALVASLCGGALTLAIIVLRR